uniref:U3 small nucleolar RNA-associated protein 6 homolog n=1 Tax=Populus davidiana TaxID=266767 RepID=A0A6M2ERM1_9ROSI
MADTVQYKLERMVDELDDLERKGIFTRQEIAEIVKQRRKFEYRLKRPSPLKQDFLAYIDYETQLDSLRRLRKNSVARELEKQGDKRRRRNKKSVSDFAGISRIVEIYRISVMRFKGDLELWFRYLEFCKDKKNGRMKKVLAQLIRFHPKVPGVWIYAAAWEFDHNLNVSAARALMQNGLRVCPHSEDLWVEYLRMELTYLNKLRERKVALGEEKENVVHDYDMLLDEERRNDDGSNAGTEVSEMKVDLFQEKGLSILQTIYTGAVEALPSSFGLRKRLLEILEATDLTHSEEMHKEMLSDMKRDFSREPEYWDWLARLEMIDSKSISDMSVTLALPQLQKAIQVYEEALQFVPSPMMFNLYIKFLMDAIAPRGGENDPSKVSSPTEDYISHLLVVYEKADLLGCMTEDLACQYVSFYLQLGRFDEARKLADRLCSGKLSDSEKLWILRASMEIKSFTDDTSAPSKDDFQYVLGLLRSALTKVSISQAEDLWLMALNFFAKQKKALDKLVEMSLISVAKDGGSDDGFSLSSAIVNFMLQKDGIHKARKTYKRFLALPHPGLALYRCCIELEVNLASVGDKDCLANARKLYESALATYGQDVTLWQNYHSMEIKLGTSETANAVCWRARKTLKNAAAFVPAPDLY